MTQDPAVINGHGMLLEVETTQEYDFMEGTIKYSILLSMEIKELRELNVIRGSIELLFWQGFLFPSFSEQKKTQY